MHAAAAHRKLRGGKRLGSAGMNCLEAVEECCLCLILVKTYQVYPRQRAE